MGSGDLHVIFRLKSYLPPQFPQVEWVVHSAGLGRKKAHSQSLVVSFPPWPSASPEKQPHSGMVCTQASGSPATHPTPRFNPQENKFTDQQQLNIPSPFPPWQLSADHLLMLTFHVFLFFMSLTPNRTAFSALFLDQVWFTFFCDGRCFYALCTCHDSQGSKYSLSCIIKKKTCILC